VLGRYTSLGEYETGREAIAKISEAVSHPRKIEGRTHNFYRYPACFPPDLPREVIKSFTQPGDLVFDPFVGGGTTAVEALAHARSCLGVDLNPVAVFVSKFKTIRLSNQNIEELDDFFYRILRINVSSVKRLKFDPRVSNGIEPRFLDLIGEIKRRIGRLSTERTRVFATGVLLRECKYLCDNPYRQIDRFSILKKLFDDYEEMVDENLTFHANGTQFAKDNAVKSGRVKVLSGSINEDKILSRVMADPRPIRLVMTSPPYPGKHVLYNKWQVDGRKESYLPQWIVGSSEYDGEVKYAMGGRTRGGIEDYFNNIKKAFSNVHQVIESDGIVVQAVAFSDRRTQLRLFLDAMNEAGFSEIKNLARTYDRRVWREVPNRKWHAQKTLNKCREVVLFHRPR
jgi:DNA modification methylase